MRNKVLFNISPDYLNLLSNIISQRKEILDAVDVRRIISRQSLR